MPLYVLSINTPELVCPVANNDYEQARVSRTCGRVRVGWMSVFNPQPASGPLGKLHMRTAGRVGVFKPWTLDKRMHDRPRFRIRPRFRNVYKTY